MWEFKILGIDLYHIISWFYIYSFLGWLWESSFVSIRSKKIVNRGFITGPLCTIYGCGGVSIYLIASPYSDNIVLLFLIGMIVATVIEYLTAVIMETLFHASWWNYSRKKFNFQGRICLDVSLGWGLFTLVLFYVFHPFVEFIVQLYSRKAGIIGIYIISIIFLVDFINSVVAASGFSKKMASLESILEETTEYIKTTKLYISSEELIDRMDLYKRTFHDDKWKNRVEEYKQRLSERLADLGIQENKKEITQKIMELNKKYINAKNKMGFVSKRFIKAYPNILTITKKSKDKKAEEEK
ncbi:MAG TPA: putative ABC transporter permease [Candidatus Merdenecus merdavium]|nr:putative ABC transporter permease [Candidatus Merdenecus merdavium]